MPKNTDGFGGTDAIRTLDDVDRIAEAVADMAASGWDQDAGHFDWEGFLERVERYPEDKTPVRAEIISRTNTALAAYSEGA